jgi:hypothetical protein
MKNRQLAIGKRQLAKDELPFSRKLSGLANGELRNEID